MQKLVLVDAHGYLHRAYHALPPLTTSKGEPVNAIYGFTRMLFKLLREHRPDYVAVCFDAPGKTFRHKIYGEYKATRKETDNELRLQFPLSREVVRAMGLAQFELEGFEADDLIATLARKAEKDGHEVLIVSGDKDILQIVGENIKVLNEPKQILFDSKEVEKKWGVKPEEIVDMFTLIGDSSDNVPGVYGIGEKTAAKLIREFGTIEKLMEGPPELPEKVREKIVQGREQIVKSKELLTLVCNVPIQINWDECKPKMEDQNILITLLKRLEFHKFVSELYSKGIFSARKEDLKVSENYETVLSENQLKNLIKTLESSDSIAVDVETTGLNVRKAELVGIAVSWKKDCAAYIPLRHRTLGSEKQMSAEKTTAALKTVLENEKIKKIGHNIKFDFSILCHAGIRMKNIYFDTMVASYCLDPSKSSHRLKDLVTEHFGHEMTRIEELLPQEMKKAGSQEFPMDQVDIEKASPYACADADYTLQLAEKFSGLLKEKESEMLFYKTEMPLVEILAEMEMNGVKIEKNYLEELGATFSKEIQALESRAYELSGQQFNLNSPKQLGFILFEKLKLPVIRKTKTGFSTDEEVLRQLSSAHDLPRILIEHRELSKLKSTFIDSLLSLMEPKRCRVHTSFNQAVTATGRLSSSDPNLQNIPIRTEHGRTIRRAFIPEEGCIFLSADYSQIDLRVLAHLSQDETLCKAFRQGADIHRSTAAEVFHLPMENVAEEHRRRAKAINFGIAYGQQAYGLSQSLGISMKEAQEMIDQYFQKYSGVKKWIEHTIQEARIKGYVKTLLGRTRYITEINSKNGAVRAFAERTAINTPVQGTSADIIKVAMVKIDETLKRKNLTDKVRMLLQVHDDLLFEVPKSEIGEIAPMVKEEMENAMQLSVPILIDLKSGGNWADMEPLK